MSAFEAEVGEQLQRLRSALNELGPAVRRLPRRPAGVVLAGRGSSRPTCTSLSGRRR